MINEGDFIPLDDYRKLPVGTHLVKIDDTAARGCYHVATVSINEIIVVGGAFSWDRKPLLAYFDITNLEQSK